MKPWEWWTKKEGETLIDSKFKIVSKKRKKVFSFDPLLNFSPSLL